MNWSDERYVRLYTRDTPDWMLWPWQSRALLPLLMRKCDRAGVIELGKYGTKGLAAVVGMPVEVVDAGLAGLLEDGCVIRDSADRVIIRNFIEAQEAKASDAARARKYRETHRTPKSHDVTDTSRDVTEPSHSVTPRHDSSQAVTPSLAVPSRAEPSHEEQEPPNPPAGGVSGGAKPSRDRMAPVEPDGPAAEVWAHYVARVAPKAKCTAERLKIIKSALRSYAVADLKRTIDGYAVSPFHNGDNDRRQKHLGIELFLRDSKHIEAGWTFSAAQAIGTNPLLVNEHWAQAPEPTFTDPPPWEAPQ